MSRLGIGLRIDEPRRSGGGGAAAAAWRLASIRAGETPFGTTGTSNSAVERTTSRVRDRLGPATYAKLRVIECGFQVTTANVESSLANAVAVQRAIEIASPAQVQRVLYGGASAGSVAAGAHDYASDDILPATFGLSAFAGGTDIWHRLIQDVATGQSILQRPSTGPGTPAGEASWRSATSVDQLMATGALSATGTARSVADASPCLLIGLASDHGATVGVSGDSRFYGFGGDDGPGTASAGGPIRMALEAAGVPHFIQARSSTQLSQIISGSGWLNYVRRLPALGYVSDVISNYGTNDLNAGVTATQLIARLQTYVTLVGAAGVERVWWTTIAPRTNPSNVPAAGFANSDSDGRKAFNDSLRANWASWGLAGYVDVSAAVENPAQTDLWASLAYTTDGVHSTQAGQLLEKAPLESWANAL